MQKGPPGINQMTLLDGFAGMDYGLNHVLVGDITSLRGGFIPVQMVLDNVVLIGMWATPCHIRNTLGGPLITGLSVCPCTHIRS